MDSQIFRNIREEDFRSLPGEMADWIDSWDFGGMEGKGITREFDTAQNISIYLNNWNKNMPVQHVAPPAEFVADSHKITSRVYAKLTDLTEELPNFLLPMPVDFQNAEEFSFMNPYPLPARTRVKKILDFGPGFGRQINVWSQQTSDLVFCSMEAIENGYIVQNNYYQLADVANVSEYFDSPDNFQISDTPGIYHLPTWRTDLLPEDFFDLIICVGVLPELNETLLNHLLPVFSKILRSSGAIFIKDHSFDRAARNGMNIDQEIENCNFNLEFVPDLIDLQETWMIPRIWRKIDVERSSYAERLEIFKEQSKS